MITCIYYIVNKVTYDLCQVFDYDWMVRDDFIGQAGINLRDLANNTPTDVLLTLHDDTGKDRDGAPAIDLKGQVTLLKLCL